MERLADTAGAQVIGRTIQRIDAPTPNFYLGQGKVELLKDELAAAGATLVLFDESLTPLQGVKLEKHLDVRVMDRTEVILDIFATRAKSHEAKLQVELAQLEYLLRSSKPTAAPFAAKSRCSRNGSRTSPSIAPISARAGGICRRRRWWATRTPASRVS